MKLEAAVLTLDPTVTFNVGVTTPTGKGRSIGDTIGRSRRIRHLVKDDVTHLLITELLRERRTDNRSTGSLRGDQVNDLFRHSNNRSRGIERLVVHDSTDLKQDISSCLVNTGELDLVKVGHRENLGRLKIRSIY